MNNKEEIMYRIQFEVEDELITERVTSEQVVEALVSRFSSMNKPKEEIVVDLFRAVDKEVADEIAEDIMRRAAMELQKKRPNYSLTNLVEKLISPVGRLIIMYKDIIVEFIKNRK
jgi:Ca2+-binding EF-hand superfamily protein